MMRVLLVVFIPITPHISPFIYLWRLLTPVIVTSLNLTKATFTFGSYCYDFFFPTLDYADFN